MSRLIAGWLFIQFTFLNTPVLAFDFPCGRQIAEVISSSRSKNPTEPAVLVELDLDQNPFRQLQPTLERSRKVSALLEKEMEKSSWQTKMWRGMKIPLPASSPLNSLIAEFNEKEKNLTGHRQNWRAAEAAPNDFKPRSALIFKNSFLETEAELKILYKKITEGLNLLMKDLVKKSRKPNGRLEALAKESINLQRRFDRQVKALAPPVLKTPQQFGLLLAIKDRLLHDTSPITKVRLENRNVQWLDGLVTRAITDARRKFLDTPLDFALNEDLQNSFLLEANEPGYVVTENKLGEVNVLSRAVGTSTSESKSYRRHSAYLDAKCEARSAEVSDEMPSGGFVSTCKKGSRPTASSHKYDEACLRLWDSLQIDARRPTEAAKK